MKSLLCILLLSQILFQQHHASAQVAVGDTVWCVRHQPGDHLLIIQDSHICFRLLSTVSYRYSVEGFVMDTFCIELKTLLDNPSIKTLEGPGNHTLHWYAAAA